MDSRFLGNDKMGMDSHFHGNDKCTMHRARGKQKTIKKEGHNSLCPYKIKEHGFSFARE